MKIAAGQRQQYSTNTTKTVYLQVLELHRAKQEIDSLTIESMYELIHAILGNVSNGLCGEEYVSFWHKFQRNKRYFQLFRNNEKETRGSGKKSTHWKGGIIQV